MDRKHIGQSNINESFVILDPSPPYRTSSPLRESTPFRKSPLRDNDDLSTVLKSEGLGHLVDIFMKEKIDLNILMEMEKSEILEIGVDAFGDRHALYKLL